MPNTFSAPNSLNTKSLNRELQDYAYKVEAIKRDTDELLERMTDAEFNWRPSEHSWSIAQCLVHLNLTNELYLAPMRQAIKEAKAQGLFADGPFKHSFFGNLFVRSIEPPPRMKFKVPARVLDPPPDQPLADVRSKYMKLQDEILMSMEEANGVHLAKVKVQSPFSKLIRLSLGQCFALLTAHERRHLWQARQVKSHPKFGLS